MIGNILERWSTFSAINVEKNFGEEIDFALHEVKDYLRDHQRKMHQAKDGMWMCIKGSSAEKPKSFVNNHLLSRHQHHHESFPCTKCQKSFGAKKNMVRYLNTVHKAPEGGSDRNLDEPHNELT